MPVAASTLSLMMLSLDRYAAVKHPRVLARMGRQSGLPAAMAVFVWFGATAVSAPIIAVRSVTLVSRRDVSGNRGAPRPWIAT